MMDGEFLACDWGGTNLRAWRIGGDNKVLAAEDFALGVSRLSPGDAERRFRDEVRPALNADHVPAILCGMIGSELGWRTAGYLDCPATLDAVARALVNVDSGSAPVWIVPGLKGPGPTSGAPEVMRGEETQVLGWLGQDEARGKGRRLFCHPGTHSKWVLAQDGAVERFVTCMTGELFDLLKTHSLLRSDSPATDDAAFDEGVTAAGDGGALAARLFSVRARVSAGVANPKSTSSYLSGLLIGAEVASAPALLGVGPREAIQLIGEPSLCDRYARAFASAGRPFHRHGGDEAAIAGLIALFRRLHA